MDLSPGNRRSAGHDHMSGLRARRTVTFLTLTALLGLSGCSAVSRVAGTAREAASSLGDSATATASTLTRPASGMAADHFSITPASSQPASSAAARLDATGAVSQVDVTAKSTYWFRTPSKNITCLMSTSDSSDSDATVRCTIVAREWKAPARPAHCPLDWGNDLEVGPAGTPGFVCARDTVLGASITVNYGTRLIMKPNLACAVSTSGVTCANTVTGQGFALSREAYSLF